MENFRALILPLFIFLLFPTSAFSYGQFDTHPALTQEIVLFFNHHYPEQSFSNVEAWQIIKGSMDEDNRARFFHHFYDPIYERGLITGEGSRYLSSKEWAKDTKAQGLFLNPNLAGSFKLYFSADTDHSWDRTIYEYVHGDKDYALYSLGHILHLIEDAGVPAHTRNDPHDPIFGGGSPYEDFAHGFHPGNIDVAGKLIETKESPFIFDNLYKYFENTASFSNNNFFSQDTILNGKYLNPTITQRDLNIVLSNGKRATFKTSSRFNNLKLLRVVRRIDLLTKSFSEEFSTEDPDNLILTDYWNLLSKEVVKNGAGVIKLFFDEVEKEKQTLALRDKNTSELKKIISRIPFFGSASLSTSDNSENLAQQSSENDTALSPPVLTQENNDNEPELVQTEEIENEEQDSEEAEEINEEIIEEDDNNEETGNQSEESGEETENNELEGEVILPGSTSHPSFDGGGAVVNDNEEAENETEDGETEEDSGEEDEGEGGGDEGDDGSEEPEPIPLFIESPDNFQKFSTTTVEFTGTSTPGSVISNDFNSATTTPDEGGGWSMIFNNFSQGTTTISFLATKDSVDSANISREIFINSELPVISSFEIYDCNFSVQSGTCTVPVNTINLSWDSSSTNISEYQIYRNGVFSQSVVSTSTTETLSAGDHTFEIVAINTFSNRATSSPESIKIIEPEVVINEVAWSGTEASSSDEWIELYNLTSESIELENFVLMATDDAPFGVPYLNLTGAIPAKDYYLIERGEDNSATSEEENLFTAFSGLGGGSGLSNSGEKLQLLYVGFSGTTTIDSTPEVAACGGWCGGESAPTKISMEKIHPHLDGSLASSWSSNNTFFVNGLDADDNVINGTPKAQNSIDIKNIGYYCPPHTSTFIDGESYEIDDVGIGENLWCTYLSPNISGRRYGAVFKGTIANSTEASAHSLGPSTTKEQNDNVYGDAVNGDSYLTAIFEVRTGPAFSDDLDLFINYFTDGSNGPPHRNYGILEWKYASTTP